jgi:(2R)-3-sulfolactate dehydrogenase (NADP+)
VDTPNDTPDVGNDVAKILVEVEPLRRLTVAILIAAGLRATEAETTAKVLVASDMRGIASHGVARLDWYVTMIGEGGIDSRATTEVVRESASTASAWSPCATPITTGSPATMR